MRTAGSGTGRSEIRSPQIRARFEGVTGVADFYGPMFDGAAARAAEDLRAEIEREVADKGFSMVQGRLMQVIRQPTPYYWTQLKTISRRGGTEVTGEDVIYHWWLEGVGSRNFPVTRFKGYRSFAITAAALRQIAQGIAESVMAPYVRRMNR